jgi:hypothetical protein
MVTKTDRIRVSEPRADSPTNLSVCELMFFHATVDTPSARAPYKKRGQSPTQIQSTR